MNSQGFSPARLPWPAYEGGRKRRIIVASTCRRSVEFGRYVTWLWMANCASVMAKMLPLYNVAIPCRASDFPRSRKSRGIRGIADLKRNP